MAPLFAYLDMNCVEDFCEPRTPIRPEMRGELLAAVEEGRIILPFSEAVSQEIVALYPTNPDQAGKLARFYLIIASLDHYLESSGMALRRVIGEALGDMAVSPFSRSSPEEKRVTEDLLLGKGDIAEIIAGYTNACEQWMADCRESRDGARALLEAKGPIQTASVAAMVTNFWSDLAPYYGRGLLEGRGLMERAQEQKMTDQQLLGVPGLRAAVGVAIGLFATQTVNGRNPHRGDYADFQHCTLADCAALPLVTRDADLRKLLAGIPGTPLETITPMEMLSRVRG